MATRKLAMVSMLVSLVLVGDARPEENPVRMVLQITVDGLRADMLETHNQHLGEHGFRYFEEQGVVYTNAHYGHANTETIVGHATLATGAHPAIHGMTGNVWFDEATGELAYNIEDPQSPLLPVREQAQTSAQVDPSQRRARTAGRSPHSLQAETLADVLLRTHPSRSRAFGVSGKDRSAVAMTGKRGKAYWYSSDSGDFVTSAWYYDAYPDWVASWNAERAVDRLAGDQWSLDPHVRYARVEDDDRAWEIDLRGYGRTFPHAFGEPGNKLLYTQIMASPEGDRLTAEFAKRLINAEQLGREGQLDYLSVSFSGVDAVSHFFGPASLENEAMVRALDQILADFLAFVDDTIGLQHVLLVLSADHGMAEMPETMAEQGFNAGRLYTSEVVTLARDFAGDTWGEPALVREFFRPFLYLDNEVLSQHGLDRDEVAERLSAHLESHEGVRLATTRQRLDSVSDRGIAVRIANNWHPERSGEIYLVQEPYWFNFDRGPVAAMHGSPWPYDTHVPIMLAGPGVVPGVQSAPVQPADVAPTMAALLGLPAPSQSQGRVLTGQAQ